jgi:hypothetical protein
VCSSSSSSSSESGGESDTERHDSKKTVKKARHIETKEDLEKIRSGPWTNKLPVRYIL